MRLVINILIFLIFLIGGLIIFMPKSQLYYYGEKMLNEKGIIISDEKIKETPIDLTISNGNIYAQGALVASIALAKVQPYILFNKAEINNVELKGLAKDFLNISIDKAIAKESILKPFIVALEAEGSFGKAVGWVDLKNRLIHIDIVEAKNINPIRKYMHKNEQGWYYESKF